MQASAQVDMYRFFATEVIELRDRFCLFMQSFTGDFDDSFDSSFEFFGLDEYVVAWIESELRLVRDDYLDLSPVWNYHYATLVPFVLIMAHADFVRHPDKYQFAGDCSEVRQQQLMRRADLPLISPISGAIEPADDESQMSRDAVEILIHRLWRS